VVSPLSDQAPGDDAFARLLDEIAADDAGDAGRRAAADAWAALSAQIALALAGSADPGDSRPARLHRRFVDGDTHAGDAPTSDQMPIVPERATRAELERLRRLFARVNHPDRVPSGERDAANHRMAMFNRMIDERLRHARSA
jgi:hypothetical protein